MTSKASRITMSYMIRYSDDVFKRVKKRLIPKEIFTHIHNSFLSLDLTKDFSLFDIKQLKISEEAQRIYYRLRNGKYRAIFYVENEILFVIAIDKREEVYKKWQ